MRAGAVDRVLAKFGSLSVLIHNAGRSQRARWEYTNIQVRGINSGHVSRYREVLARKSGGTVPVYRDVIPVQVRIRPFL